MKTIISKTIHNGFFLTTVLLISAFLYATAFEKSELSAIDEFEKFMTNVLEDPVFIDEYNAQMETDDMGEGDIEELKNGLSRLYILKSRYLQGPLRFFTSIVNYYLSVLGIYIILAFSRLIYKDDQKTTLTTLNTILFPYWGIIIFENVIMALYVFLTKQSPAYNPIFNCILILLGCVSPFYLVIKHRLNKKEHCLPLLLCGILVVGFNIWLALIA